MTPPNVWIESEGGPLILMHEKIASKWRGTESGDYRRACKIDDFIGEVSAGDSVALVIGDEPTRTTIFADEQDFFIVRWLWAPNEAVFWARFLALKSEQVFDDCMPVQMLQGRHVLFDSAYPGDCCRNQLSASIDFNYVSVRTALVKEQNVGMILHRFCKT